MDIDLLNEVRILDLAARILNICAEFWLPGYCRCRFFDCPNIKYAVLFGYPDIKYAGFSCTDIICGF